MSGFDDIPTWNAGHRVTGAEAAKVMALLSGTGTNGGLWSEMSFLKAANQTFASSTTLQSDVDFIVPLVANATYILDGYFPYTSNGTALFKGAWSLPAGASGTWDPAAIPSTVTTGQSSALLQQAFSLATTLTYGYGSSSSAFHAKGTLVVGATAGSAVWQFAQSVSTAVQTGMLAGAWLTVRRFS